MAGRYIVFKCAGQGREPIACYDAADMDEAKDTLAWLRKRHGTEADFRLEAGEFFEILERGQVEPGQWEEALNRLCRQKGGRA